MITIQNWIKFFPHKEVRPEQETAINFILNAFSKNKFVLLDAPPGSGKSAIAITVAKYIDNKKNHDTAYITTTQKILQEQYFNEFTWLANVWSKSNYECKNAFGLSCELGLLLQKIKNKNNIDFNNYKNTCPYEIDKNKFVNSSISLTNISFLIYQLVYSELIKRRSVLIIDEAHDLDNTITKSASMTFTKNYTDKVLKIKWPVTQFTTQKEFMSWIKATYLRTLEGLIEKSTDKISNNLLSENIESESGKFLMKNHTNMENQIQNIKKLIEVYSEIDWVMSINDHVDVVNLRPIYADSFTNKLFKIADNVLMMSGTILNKSTFCKNVGILESECEYLSLDSSFPAKNRPVLITLTGSMSYKNIQGSLPKIANAVTMILENHPNEKGIIHATSYKICEYIVNHVNSDRLLLHDTTDRMEVLDYHKKTDKPTVLISPSFTEGIDLCGDLSRFQILCKIPFPYLGDTYINVKKEKIKDWYSYQTAKTIIQALGRSVRSKDDMAISYILDSDWKFFYNINKKFFPKWFSDAIQNF